MFLNFLPLCQPVQTQLWAYILSRLWGWAVVEITVVRGKGGVRLYAFEVPLQRERSEAQRCCWRVHPLPHWPWHIQMDMCLPPPGEASSPNISSKSGASRMTNHVQSHYNYWTFYYKHCYALGADHFTFFFWGGAMVFSRKKVCCLFPNSRRKKMVSDYTAKKIFAVFRRKKNSLPKS